MPQLSSKSLAMPESPIRKLVPYAEAAKATGKTVYHLNIGQPDIETPKEVMHKLKNLDLEVIEYSHSAGFLSYREGLAKYYNNIGINLDPNKGIMITTGGSEALIFAFQCCFLLNRKVDDFDFLDLLLTFLIRSLVRYVGRLQRRTVGITAAQGSPRGPQEPPGGPS